MTFCYINYEIFTIQIDMIRQWYFHSFYGFLLNFCGK